MFSSVPNSRLSSIHRTTVKYFSSHFINSHYFKSNIPQTITNLIRVRLLSHNYGRSRRARKSHLHKSSDVFFQIYRTCCSCRFPSRTWISDSRHPPERCDLPNLEWLSAYRRRYGRNQFAQGSRRQMRPEKRQSFREVLNSSILPKTKRNANSL